MIQKFFLGCLVVLVAACSNPVTNGSGTEQGSMGTIESAISWTKKLVRGWTAKASLQIPAQGVIADALLDPQFVGGRLEGGMMREASTYLTKMGDFKTVFGEKLGPAAESDDKEAPFLVPVAAVTQAYRGWQINLLGGFGESIATSKEQQFYLAYQEAAVEYTNGLMTEIATQLNEDVGVLEDPVTAKAEVQRIYKSIPKSTLKKLWTDAVVGAANRGGRIIDLAGSNGVDWSADGGSYSGNADGLTWTKAGVPWFGQGALSGKQWTIGLESSIAKSTDKSSGGSEGLSGGTGQKTTGGAQPK